MCDRLEHSPLVTSLGSGLLLSLVTLPSCLYSLPYDGLLRHQSLVKITEIGPFWCGRKDPSAWFCFSHHNSISNSRNPSSVRSCPLRMVCSFHHFAAPISSARKASISPAFWRNWFLTVLVRSRSGSWSYRPLVHCPVGWMVPDDLSVLFLASSHFCSDVCLFIQWVP